MARLLVLFVTAFVDMVGLTMIIPLLPFYATELGASATVVGLLVSAFAVAQLVVAKDGFPLEQPYMADTLVIACGPWSARQSRWSFVPSRSLSPPAGPA